MKRRAGYFKSLRFRIMLILVLVGIIPSVLALHFVISSYEEKAIEVRTAEILKECRIISGMLARKGFLPDADGQVSGAEDEDAPSREKEWEDAAGRLELLANVYRGRILIISPDYTVVKDTYGLDEGEVLLSPLLFACMRGEEAHNYEPLEETLQVAA